jgi:hypothetical protein
LGMKCRRIQYMKTNSPISNATNETVSAFSAARIPVHPRSPP